MVGLASVSVLPATLAIPSVALSMTADSGGWLSNDAFLETRKATLLPSSRILLRILAKFCVERWSTCAHVEVRAIR